MSFPALEWAWRQPLRPAGLKLALVALADFANAEGQAWPSVGTLAEKTGMGRSTVVQHVKRLAELGLVSKTNRADARGHRTSTLYGLVLGPNPGPRKAPQGPESGLRQASQSPDFGSQSPDFGSQSPDPGLKPSEEPSEDPSEIKPLSGSTRPRDAGRVPFAAIIEHLNEKIGARFKPTSKATRRHIKARWTEGFRLADFIKVVDAKAAQWGGDSKMAEYLRPATLFGSNFESYLQAATTTRSKNDGANREEARTFW